MVHAHSIMVVEAILGVGVVVVLVMIAQFLSDGL
jgi:hypothetical protein